jgi:hypothetical protein
MDKILQVHGEAKHHRALDIINMTPPGVDQVMLLSGLQYFLETSRLPQWWDGGSYGGENHYPPGTMLQVDPKGQTE